MSKENNGKSKGKSNGTKGAIQGSQRLKAKVKRRQRVSEVLKTCYQKQARKLRNQCKWHRFVPLSRRGFMMNGVLTNGKTTGV